MLTCGLFPLSVYRSLAGGRVTGDQNVRRHHQLLVGTWPKPTMHTKLILPEVTQDALGSAHQAFLKEIMRLMQDPFNPLSRMRRSFEP